MLASSTPMKTKNHLRPRRVGMVLIALLLATAPHSGFPAETPLLDFQASWRSEVSRGHYASCEFFVIALSTRQLEAMRWHGGRRTGPEESLGMLVTQKLVTVSVDEPTRFRNYIQTGIISAADNPLNAPVSPQTITVSQDSLNRLIIDTLISFGKEPEQTQVSANCFEVWPVNVVLTGSNLNLRAALNQIGRAVACGWSFIYEYTPQTGRGVTVEFVSLPPRGRLPQLGPPEGQLSTNDSAFLLETARKGDRNERRLALGELSRWYSDESVLTQAQDLAVELLRGPDIQLRYDAIAQLPFVFKIPFDDCGDCAKKQFPKRLKDIDRIRESTDLNYLLQLLKTGDALERGVACERLSMGIVNSPQFSSAQIDTVWDIFVSLLSDKDAFVRKESADALKMICGLNTR